MDKNQWAAGNSAEETHTEQLSEDVGPSSSTLPAGKPVIPFKYIFYIKKEVSDKWKDLAGFLGFDPSTIANIAGRNSDDISHCGDMLGEWQRWKRDKATMDVLIEALTDAELGGIVNELKRKFPELKKEPMLQAGPIERNIGEAAAPVLPVSLHLGLEQQVLAMKQAGDIDIRKYVQVRILELEHTLFTVEVFRDPELYRRTQELFLAHLAILQQIIGGSVIVLLTFLRQTDVDRFYHNHYRVGEGTLSQQLSHILISDKLRDKIKGAQLIVRLHVKHEDYVRVRSRLGQGLYRTTSVDNLLALSAPRRQVDCSSVRWLDLAVISREDRPCTDRLDDISMQNFTAEEVQGVVQTIKEKSQEQVKVHLQTMQRQVLTARQGADAMGKEVKRLNERNEKAEKMLLEQKAEMNEKIHQLQETNKNMEAKMEELQSAKHPVESGSQEKDPGKEKAPGKDPGKKDDHGMERTTSVDNLLALAPPSRQVDHSSLTGLDLAVTSRQGRSCTDRTDDVSALNFTAKQVQTAMQASKEKSQQEVRHLEGEMRAQLHTAKHQTDAMVHSLTQEITRLRKEEEKAQKILLEQEKEIQILSDANKSKAATIEEMTYAKHTAKVGNQGEDAGKEKETVKKKTQSGPEDAMDSTKKGRKSDETEMDPGLQLFLAARDGDVEAIKKSLNEAVDVNMRWHGDTALHAASAKGHDELVELLLKNGADLTMTNQHGDTALHAACAGGHGKVVELLIKNGADLNMTNQGGYTALHVSCRQGHGKVVELLIKNGADLNVTDQHGDTALHAACAGGHGKVVELLIKNGADLNVTNQHGDTALHAACAGGHGKVVELLIKNGADLNMTNQGGYTALHVSCRQGHGKVVELLIKNGADLNVTDQHGDTALHAACAGGQDKVVELLIKNGADLNVTNQHGDTPLHVACRGGRGKVVELLIRIGVDFLVTNLEDKRPIDLAATLDRSTRSLIETETRKQAEYSELVSSVGSEEGTVKLFICGDGQVGKTSLQSILTKTILGGVIWNIRTKFRGQDIFNPTPGVHVSSKTVRGIGRLSLHDFAGQAQFYVTHAMLLRTTNAIFPIVYKITDGEEEQKRQVHGWLSFIHCSNADPTNRPRVVLIASHADKLQDQEAGLRRATALVEHYRKLFEESLAVSQEVFLINCMEAGSPGIGRLRQLLATFRDDILQQRPAVPKVCVQLLAMIEGWRKERKAFPVMEWQDYLAAVRKATSYLSERIIQLATSYLHDEGEIVYLRHISDSLVVLDCQWLFTSVFGRLLAPDNFPIDRVERTAEDYITLEELTRVFSAIADIPLLIKLLQDFQLCHTYMYDGRTFILPSLLQHEMEEAAWSPVSNMAVYFGLQIRCRMEIDIFSCDLFPRLQTLLMQAHPDKLRRPLLWKNSAKCTDGKAEALLQITQDRRQLNIIVRTFDGNREDCNYIIDLLKDMTYRLLHETSPGARSRDMVLSALDLREHRLQPHAYSREEVEAAAAKGENLIHPLRNVPEEVKDLLLHL
ncbi:uncharacterized protein LOC144868635 [Branchiostoma floridae x Branchiostoma japonicum]